MSSYSYHKNISVKTKFLNAIKNLFKNEFCERFFIRNNGSAKDNSILLKLMPQEYLYPKGSLRNYDRNGEKFELDISNVIDHAKYFGYGETGFKNLEKKIEEDFTIVDIGANIGTTSITFARLARRAKVIAFEPSLETFNRLVKHINLNNLKNIIAINGGIGRKTGESKLYKIVESNPGMNRILPDSSVDDTLEFERVSIDTLVNQLKKLQIETVNLIKIDVEGYEFEVLKGAEEIIERCKPLLFIELDDNNLKQCGSSATELINFLDAKNYLIKEAISLKVLSKNNQFENCHFDIICEPLESGV